ncbi:Peptidyl-tRNA hydrolase [[Mycoplasma] cavipharyngis]|uniref:aminoacyl-tRNA hydrolase n=1 Tax=[Mycoplasma] cavipharyngis TaxID=92757 RepID=UPI003704523F
MKTKIIFGLGNPGWQYYKTRHNIGFIIIDHLIKKFDFSNSANRFIAECVYGYYNDQTKVILIKPQTYMNLSGVCVLNIMQFFKVNLNDILIIYDDLDLTFGKIRMKQNGSAGGQKGMADIIEKLKTDQIYRIKLGIGPKKGDAKNFVLSNFSDQELLAIEQMSKKVFMALKMFLDDQKPEKIMNFLN